VITSGLRVQGTQEIAVPAAVNVFSLIHFNHIRTLSSATKLFLNTSRLQLVPWHFS